MRSTIVSVAVVVIFLSVPINDVPAKCAGRSLDEEYKDAVAVFIGSVINIAESYISVGGSSHPIKVKQNTVRMKVEESFKGVEKGAVEVVTDGRCAECFYNFKHGERYLVYAGRSLSGSELRVSVCTRTRMLADANEEIECLRSINQPNAQSRIFGSVMQYTLDFEQGFGSKVVGAMPGIIVVVEGRGNRYELTTDAAGYYRLGGLSPGSYTVQAMLPKHYDGGSSRNVIVRGRECAEMYFAAQANGSISGSVFDQQGRPARYVAVTIRRVEDEETGTHSQRGMWEHTDENGNYKFKSVPAGRYLIGVNIAFAPDTDAPYAPTYFPGVSDATQASTINLDEGQQLDNQNILLGAPLPARVIRGQVQWSDGRPVIGAIITLVDMEYPKEEIAGKTETDARGRFVLTGFKNRRYKIYAYTAMDGVHEQLAAEPAEVSATETERPITMVIKVAQRKRLTSSR